MKVAIVFAAVVACAFAASLQSDKDAVITRYDNDNIGVGEYTVA